jgi:hypothetical protein
MDKRYSTITPTVQEDKAGPSETCLQTILNFSKSTEVKKSKLESHLVHLN